MLSFFPRGRSTTTEDVQTNTENSGRHIRRKSPGGSFHTSIEITDHQDLFRFYNRYIFLVVFPIMFTAIFRDSILWIIKDAILFPLPVMKDGRLPSLLKHSLTTSSGASTRGLNNPVLPGSDFIYPGVDVAPAQQPIISMPLFFHSYQRLSDRIMRKAFVAAYTDR